MKLLQLNCWGGKLSTQIKKLRDLENPDIVCLQEAYDITLRPGSTFESPSDMFPLSSYPYQYFGKVYSIRYMKELADFGNAISSKLPLENPSTNYTRGEPFDDIEVLDGNDYNVRNFIHTTVKVDGKDVHLLNHHGHHDPASKDGSPENTRQMQVIADYIDTLEGPIILAGDFNLHQQSESLRPIHDRLRDLCSEFTIESTRTELAKRQEVIDYVFASKEINVQQFYASDMIASDHKALILEFDL